MSYLALLFTVILLGLLWALEPAAVPQEKSIFTQERQETYSRAGIDGKWVVEPPAALTLPLEPARPNLDRLILIRCRLLAFASPTPWTDFTPAPEGFPSALTFRREGGHWWLYAYLPRIPAGQIKFDFFPLRKVEVDGCQSITAHTNRNRHPFKPYFEEFRYKPSARKRVVFLGASTMVDNGSHYPLPQIFQLAVERNLPGKVEVINMSSWSAVINDFLLNWRELQSPEIQRPYFSHSPIGAKSVLEPAVANRMPFGIRDTQPDLLVFSPMWNDLGLNYFLLRYRRKAGIPAEGGVPLTYRFMSAHFRCVHDPAACQRARDWSRKISDTATPAMPLEQGMRLHYELLLRDFVRTVNADRPKMKLLLLALPFGVTDQFSPEVRKFADNKNFRYVYRDSGADITFWSIVNRIQRSTMEKVAKEEGVGFIDLGTEYYEEAIPLSPQEMGNWNIFGDGDQMHFRPTGNIYFALKLERLMRQQGWLDP